MAHVTGGFLVHVHHALHCPFLCLVLSMVLLCSSTFLLLLSLNLELSWLCCFTSFCCFCWPYRKGGLPGVKVSPLSDADDDTSSDPPLVSLRQQSRSRTGVAQFCLIYTCVSQFCGIYLCAERIVVV